MIGKIKILISLMLVAVIAQTASAGNHWQSGLENMTNVPASTDSVMTFDEVMNQVAAFNPSLRSLSFKREATQHQLTQAGLKPNPELSTEFEDLGFSSPGLSQPEITIALSQEFEIFGQRKARQQIALADINATNFETKLEAFDLYIETKQRFNQLLFSQEESKLADSSVVLAENIVSNIEFRMDNGIAPESELLLAKLELQRAKLTSNEAKQNLYSAQLSLTSLWNSTATNIVADAPQEPDLAEVLNIIPTLVSNLDSSRYMMQIDHSKNITLAQKNLAKVETKPSITLSGGYRRVEADNSNSFLIGVALPLPLFNRNQGETASLTATLRSQEFEQERIRLETKSYLKSSIARFNQLFERHQSLDTILLPTAEHAYTTLHESYNSGRIPYLTLLEAERSLIELQFEHNEVLYEINEQLILLEQISGLKLF